MNYLKVGEISKESKIYRCGNCKEPKALLSGDKAPLCDFCGENKNWKETNKEIIIKLKDVKKEIENKLSLSDKISQKITDFCGSMTFIYLHLIWFTVWIIYNSTSVNAFDPFPFGFLTLIVSLEAILLATFILIAQNRQGEVSEMRSELDYQVDLTSEKRSAEIILLLKTINSKLDGKKKK